MTRSVLGLDIGGANLKAAHSSGRVLHQPFELWKNPSQLPRVLEAAFETLPPFDVLAVTMTGELCDCFESKRQGVHCILDAVAQAAGPIPVRVWQTDGRLVDLAAAQAAPLLAAAANWLALAAFAGRLVPAGPGLVVDVGSTTTDLIPLWDGRPVPEGRTDQERLRSRELVYTGVRRTPLCALLGSAGAAEWFATTLDIYLVLGMIAEDPLDRATADGRPATRTAAHSRLARMFCADAETFDEAEARYLAEMLCRRQTGLLQAAFHEVVARLRLRGERTTPFVPTVLLAGSGEFLARSALENQSVVPAPRLLSLREILGPAISAAACAYAVAQLAGDAG
jgi:probable H4MPT-linked C1 transfer pathway protein